MGLFDAFKGTPDRIDFMVTIADPRSIQVQVPECVTVTDGSPNINGLQLMKALFAFPPHGMIESAVAAKKSVFTIPLNEELLSSPQKAAGSGLSALQKSGITDDVLTKSEFYVVSQKSAPPAGCLPTYLFVMGKFGTLPSSGVLRSRWAGR